MLREIREIVNGRISPVNWLDFKGAGVRRPAELLTNNDTRIIVSFFLRLCDVGLIACQIYQSTHSFNSKELNAEV